MSTALSELANAQPLPTRAKTGTANARCSWAREGRCRTDEPCSLHLSSQACVSQRRRQRLESCSWPHRNPEQLKQHIVDAQEYSAYNCVVRRLVFEEPFDWARYH
eukprot:1131221-Prymnesium_polylepis.1